MTPSPIDAAPQAVAQQHIREHVEGERRHCRAAQHVRSRVG